ncbi:hypothetical protein EV421DRAFT_1986936 [Armillaria borealis]|uniref:Uncharacterized protein n=1 Tax=Armillaria borealis TaxID=47425 RepID=A0AA39J511_9AGAR|nr:hypothetical protein EV421DRAFT_1986936 [Armillaria borealis]
MSEPNGHYSHHLPEYSRNEYGTEHVRYSPDGPWVMLGPNNASSAQLPDFTSGSLPSFQDTFSDSLGFPRSSQMTLPPAFGDSNQASGSNYNERIQNPFASSSHGNVDPAHVPLPEDREDDFPPASKLLPTVARPAAKVAGSRHSDPKGKQQADGSPAPSSLKLVKKQKSSDEENIPVKKNTAAVQPQVRGLVAHRPATDRLAGSVNTGPRRRNNAQDILQNISR